MSNKIEYVYCIKCGDHHQEPACSLDDVPAAPTKPRSVGDKLASEMTVRERFILAAYQGVWMDKTCMQYDDAKLIAEVDLMISALDKAKGETP